MAAKAEPLPQAVKFEVWSIPVKSHTPECAKIEQFAATLVPVETSLLPRQHRGLRHSKLYAYFRHEA